MSEFPAVRPSVRRYNFGEFPYATESGLTGGAVRFLHGDTAIRLTMELTYEEISRADATALRNHYRGQQGSHIDFTLPDLIWAGHSSVANIVPEGQHWRYEAEPEEDHVAGGTLINVTITLITVDFVPTAASTDSVVVYYGNSPPPLTTLEGVVVTDLAAPSPHQVVTFQGVNALQNPQNSTYAGPSWEFKSPGEVFTTDNEPFTFEYWARLGTSLPPSTYSPYAQAGSYVTADIIAYNPVGEVDEKAYSVTTTLSYEGDTGVANPLTIDIGGILGENVADDFADFFVISEASAMALTHVAIQRHNATSYTVHRNGVSIAAWTASETVPYDNTKILINMGSINVPGTAVGQARLSRGALYGTGSFTPPTTPFFTPL